MDGRGRKVEDEDVVHKFERLRSKRLAQARLEKTASLQIGDQKCSDINELV